MRWIARKLVVSALCLGLAAAVPAVPATAAPEGGRVSSIRVEGTQRIETATVLSYLALKEGDAFDSAKVDESVKTLFGTQLFADVAIDRVGNALVVKLVENPIINRVAFEGNVQIKSDKLEDEVSARPRVVYTRTRVQSDVARLLEIYRRNGYFGANVEPKIIQLEQNRVDLVYEIDEGAITHVSAIRFVGNKEFSDGSLRSEIRTRESRWYRFFSNDDTYDPDRVEFDKELLRKFYLENGYADFRVLSSAAELTEDKGSFIITFTVEEGERYKFEDVAVESAIPDLDVKPLSGVLSTSKGDWYDSSEVEDSVEALTKAVGDQSYAFVDIRPDIRRDGEKKTISLTYRIAEGERIYVERINIRGNTRTLDKVIRRELLVAEGDPYNASRIARSIQRIKNLGFFEKVDIETSEGSAPDQSVLTITVAEQSTGEISIGGGYSNIDGPLADFSYKERNLLGRGQDLGLSATLSGKRTEVDLSFTEPYFMDYDLAATFDVFHKTLDRQDESNYDETSTGFGVGFTFPYSENLRQKVAYRLESSEVNNVPATASIYIQDLEGKSLTSMVSQVLSYDTRDSRFEPSSGYVIRLGNDFAGLGGSEHYLRNRLSGSVYFGVADDFVLSLSGDAGYMFGIGDRDVRINDRFMLGGDSLRGFEVAGIGPRDVATGEALGGQRYITASAELKFPLGLPEELGLSGFVFGDAGTLTDIPESGVGIADDASLRASVGAGVAWKSPLGPLRLDFAKAVAKEDYDKTQFFRFSFGTRF